MSLSLRSLPAIVIATWTLALAAGCNASKDGPGSSVERQGARGPHRFRLQSEVKPARLTVGDPASWTLTARLPKGARTTSVLRDSAGPWMDVTAVREPAPGAAASERGGALSLQYEIRAFDLGRIPLPRTAIVVAWPEPRAPGGAAADTLEFPPDTVTVDSLTTAESSGIEPDRGPVRPGLRPIDLVLAGIAALLVLGAIVAALLLWRSRRRKTTAVQATPPEPPEAPFRRAMDALRDEVDSLPRDVFYERLSLAVRAYVAAVTGVPALDLTTRELAREIARGGRSSETVEAVVRTLDRSDLAKFARHEDPLAEARTALDDASSLIQRFAPPPPPADATPGGTRT